jgi:hypothetical protein
MADVLGALTPGLTSQAGTAGSRLYLSGIGPDVYERVAPPTEVTLVQIPTSPLTGEGVLTGDWSIRRYPVTEEPGVISDMAVNWFDKLHAYPAILELGNLLSTVVRDIEIYSSYRILDQTLDTATNNAGTGITFQNLPVLSADLPIHYGVIFQVQVSTQGQPSIDGTLDFTTSVVPLSIIITGNRVVMMPYEPEGEIRETLGFLTDILRSANGKEQRIRVRNYPRQTVDYEFKFDDDAERRRFEAFIYKWHPQTFGVPIWFESQRLTAAVTAGDTTIYLNTLYSDFRVGGLLILWTSHLVFDSLEIDSITSTSITLSSPVVNSYSVRSKVMPLRTGITKQEITGDKYAVNLSTMAIKFHITDNEVDIGDTSAFSSHNSKVMFDDYNWISRETATDSLKNLLHHIDNKIGSQIQFSDWENSHMITTKGFFCRNPQATWEMRQVLHALAGRQKSFYLPTFYEDMVATNDIVNGTDILDIENIGYSDFVDGTEPNKSIYVLLNNGTIITRQVQSSSVVSSTIERLIIDIAWPSDILVSDIRRISYLRLGRFALDNFEINHNNSGQANLRGTVQGVIQ